MKLNDFDPKPVSALMVEPYLRSTLKRVFDIIFSLLVLFFLSPILLLAAILVGLDGGSIFYYQKRVGLNGKEFKCWKFRTMVLNAEEVLGRLMASNPAIRMEWEATQKLQVDPRVTWVGKWLRRGKEGCLPRGAC